MKAPRTGPDTERRKRLGQYFSGERLARLLSSLAGADGVRTVLDPMAGVGDMLAACIDLGADFEAVVGVEIDPIAAKTCSERLRRERVCGDDPRRRVVCGNAFDPHTWIGLPTTFDLVITNPPYVRYQRNAAGTAGELQPPTAREVRTGLVATLAAVSSSMDRDAMLACAENYSGLADLAVPAWILCCARVALGGRIALVVPDTWLSRDYAAPVLYLLRRLFEIEFVVDDADMTWFSDNLARTTLVVARRVSDRGTPYAPGGHLRVRLPAAVATASSLVGAQFPDSLHPEAAFAAWADGRRTAQATGEAGSIRFAWSDERDMVRSLRSAAERHAWLPQPHAQSSMGVPEPLRRLLFVEPRRLGSLELLGWSVGQGLRTGGNDFFYVTADPDGSRFRSALLPGEWLQLPDSAARAAVRSQSDLPRGSERTVERPASHVLMLGEHALPEDVARAVGPTPWKSMTGDLERLVRVGASTMYDRGGDQVPLPELSAVRTNVRDGRAEPPLSARFWYHLPPLAPRHQPALYIPRVNYRTPTTYLNRGRSLVVDANFSTLWPTRSDAISATGLLALMSSSWTRAWLEATGTVLGGGALKVEATHLRQLLVPLPDTDEFEYLEFLGSALLAERGIAGDGSCRLIDAFLCSIIGSPHSIDALAAFARAQQTMRIGRVEAPSSLDPQ